MKQYDVLLVEDDPMYQKLIPHVLKYAKFEINLIRTSTAEQAYRKVLKDPPDLIITDWDMPGMNGLEFSRRIHLNEELKDIPVIMCTGIKTSPENLQTAFEAGVADFIRKPINKVEFLARVNSMLILSDSMQKIKEQKAKIGAEKEKADLLLNNIFPKKIAQDLKDYGKTEPEVFDNVTILIADIVDFTKKCSSLRPKRIIEELNDVFSAFDLIMYKNNCERIKTVGDAYFGVCGMPEPNLNHASNILKSAQDIIKYLTERNKKQEPKWEVRIGVHSGRIVGGIVGIHKYIYDVFGDVINTASRLEKSSKPMRIHVSEVTKSLVSNGFHFEDQAPVEVKGKGYMNMYFLKSEEVATNEVE